MTDQRDVIRLLRGMVVDPTESEQIWADIQQNPELEAIARLLSDIEAPPFPDLGRTRLCRLLKPPVWSKLVDGQTLIVPVEYGVANGVDTFDLCLTRQDRVIELAAEWPEHLRPIGFVLSDFPSMKEKGFSTRFDLPAVSPEIRPLDNTQHGARGDGRGVPISGAARTCAAATDEELARYYAKQDRPGVKNLTVACDLWDDQESKIVVVEIEYLGPSGTNTIRHPVHIDRNADGDDSGRKTLEDEFPWPTDYAKPTARVSVGPVLAEDFCHLSTEQVTTLLANEPDFTAVPIEIDDEENAHAELAYAFQLAAANDPDTVWLLRMAEEGGAE